MILCVIIEQKPGYTLPYEKLETAVYNNPHGFGLILRDAKLKKLQVIKKLKSDPKEIYDLLKDNEDIERYLHLRWKTEGEINTDNLHPFCVLHSDTLQIYFMHNGTFHTYRPDAEKVEWVNNQKRIIKPAETDSDTSKFTKKVLTPILSRFHGNDGKSDYHDPVFIDVLNKYWPGTYNRGLLISNKYLPLFINTDDWKVIKNKDGSEFYASNNDYFDDLKRGPVFEQRKEEQRKKEEEEKERRKKEREQDESPFRYRNSTVSPASSHFGRNVEHLKDIDLKKGEIDLKNLSQLLDDFDLYDWDGVYDLRNLTKDELDELVKKLSDDDHVNLYLFLTGCFGDVYERYLAVLQLVKSLQKKGVITKEHIKSETGIDIGNKVNG